MTTHRTSWITRLLAAVALLAGCGGGVDTGGTGSYSSGPIEGFGSVIVNGVHYDDSTAVVQDDEGATRSRGELRLGMTIDIEASEPGTDASGVSSAVARSIRLGSEIVGRIDSVNAATDTLVVFGQPVHLDANTVFDDSLEGGIAALAVGNVVEVHGFFNVAIGAYTATRIEPRAQAPLFRLRGFVSVLDTVARTFRIAGQTINYAGVNDLPAPLVDGRFVRVLVRNVQVGGQWEAVAVRAGARRLDDRTTVRLAGRITGIDSAQRFSVNGIPVDASAATFPDGAVARGDRVVVEGSARLGELVARKVEIETLQELLARGFVLAGDITSIDNPGRSFVVRGVTVLHSALVTNFENGTVADLGVGGRIQVRGVLSLDRTRLVATRIRFD